VLSCISAFLLSGLVFGWQPIQLLLMREGVYEDLCDEGVMGCPAQLRKLSEIFTLASFLVSLIALPAGLFLDRFGPRPTVALSGVLIIGGLVLFGISDSQLDMFSLGYALMGVGGVLTQFAAFPVSFLIPAYQSLILAGINCCFDASCLVFQVFLSLHEWTGLPRRVMFLSYSVIAFAILAPIIVLWTLVDRAKSSSTSGGKLKVEDELNGYVALGDTEAVLLAYDVQHEMQQLHSAKDEEDLSGMTLYQQFCSSAFWTILVYTCLGMLRTSLYIACVGIVLNTYGDAAGGYVYINLFGVLLPLGVFLAPVIGWTVDSIGCLNTLQLTNALSVLNYGLSLVPSLQVQAANFIVFTTYRAFLYAMTATFNAKTFGLATMGRVMGVCNCVSAFTILIQPYFISMIFSTFNGQIFVPFMTIVMAGVALALVNEAYRWHVRSKRRGLRAASPGDNPVSLVAPSHMGVDESALHPPHDEMLGYLGRFTCKRTSSGFDEVPWHDGAMSIERRLSVTSPMAHSVRARGRGSEDYTSDVAVRSDGETAMSTAANTVVM